MYEFTKTPEISSGFCHFKITNYVHPWQTESLYNSSEETVIQLPFDNDKQDAEEKIKKGLKGFDSQTVLFLRHINKIEWKTPEGNGFLQRMEKKEDDHVRAVTITTSHSESPESRYEEHWLIFERKVTPPDSDETTSMEIAFAQSQKSDGTWFIKKLADDLKLPVFFPTEKETHLGFHVQGRFDVNKSRANLTGDSNRNDYLVSETGELLIDALHWLKKRKKLNKDVLECLPIEGEFFPEKLVYLPGPSNRDFAPVAERLVQAFKEDDLLPTSSGGFCTAPIARYPHEQGLVKIFKPRQLEDLYENSQPHWLSKDCEKFKDYFKEKVGVEVVDTENVIDVLNKSFLEKQSDGWIKRFYEFLLGKNSLLEKIKKNTPIC